MTSMLTTIFAISVLTSTAPAQGPRKPGAEEARIGYFVGRWTTEGERKPSPMGPGGKFSSTDTCDWFAGGFHVICQSEGTSSRGAAVRRQFIMSYDPGEKAYRYYQINSSGDAFLVRGTVTGNVWTWTAEDTRDGKTVKGRETITATSATSYALKFEGSLDGGPWAVVTEAKATKLP
jgi:hypothetical protein